MTTTTKKTPLTSYGPVQMGDAVGLARFQVDHALAAGLIPAADRAGDRWSAAVVAEVTTRITAIRTAVGTVNDCGASNAARVLTTRLDCEVTTDTVVELARAGHIRQISTFKGWPVYCGRSIEAFNDLDALAAAVAPGVLRTADEAAEQLNIRRSDFDHLVRAGLLIAARRAESSYRSRASGVMVSLYRTGDLDALAARSDIDWDTIRVTPKGKPSILADLPTAARS